jgi:hypothetical protein
VVEAVVFAGVSTLLYHLGMGFLLFLVPLQVVLVRKGRKTFFTSLALALALIVVIKLVIHGGRIDASTAPFLLLEMFVVFVLTAGLVLIQLPELFPQARRFAVRRVTRLVLVTAVAGLLSIPLILYLRGNQAFTAGMAEVFDALAAGLTKAFGEDAIRGADAIIGEDAIRGADALEGGDVGVTASAGRTLMAFVGRIFWRGYLFSYFLVLGFSWWLGTLVGARFRARPSLSLLPEHYHGGTRGETGPKGRSVDERWPKFADFHLPDAYIWPLIGALAVVLLGLVAPLGALELAAWNAAVIFLFLYGLCGLGVLQYFLRKFRVPRGMRWLLAFCLCVLLFSPRANLAVFILVPALGVSEIWLKYRTKERSNR